jgi:hypothetical protein
MNGKQLIVLSVLLGGLGAVWGYSYPGPGNWHGSPTAGTWNTFTVKVPSGATPPRHCSGWV